MAFESKSEASTALDPIIPEAADKGESKCPMRKTDVWVSTTVDASDLCANETFSIKDVIVRVGFTRCFDGPVTLAFRQMPDDLKNIGIWHVIC